MSSDDRFFKKYEKEKKQERKQKSALDRSKYKKSDEGKHEKKHLQEGEGLLGLVVRIVSRGFIVQEGENEHLLSIKGSLKEMHHEDRNLVTIGDWVRFVPEGYITSVLPRKSALMRQDKVHGKRQIIAANVDQVLICASLVDPSLKPTLIDRYLIAAEKGNIAPIVVVNKIDRAEENRELLLAIQEAYKIANIPLIPVSASSGVGLDALRKCLEGKISVFSGQSGVGKSSLINALLGTDLPVGETTKMKKGSHTTTHPILLPIEGGYLVDTPGVKSFAIWELNQKSLDAYFDEIFKYKSGCRFTDCSHSHEEGCEVQKKVEEGLISPLRYESYLSLLGEGDTKRR